jgi:hypothetical protein
MPRGQPTFLDSNPGKKSVCQTRASQKALKAKESVAPAAETAPVPEVPVPTTLGAKEVAASTAEAGKEVAVVVAPVSTAEEAAASTVEAVKEVAVVVAPLSAPKEVAASTAEAGKEVAVVVAPLSTVNLTIFIYVMLQIHNITLWTLTSTIKALQSVIYTSYVGSYPIIGYGTANLCIIYVINAL